MRVLTATVLVAALLAAGVPGVTAQDGSQRVEVAEAGVALALPAAWDVDIEMREREDWGLSDRFEDAAPLPFWNVLYASDGGRPWCDLAWYPLHPMTLEEHAIEYELLMTPTLADVARAIEVESLVLPAGAAYRLVVYNEPTDDWTTTYLLADGVSRYLLRCVGDERHAADWLPLAESITWLGTAAGDAAGGVAASPEP